RLEHGDQPQGDDHARLALASPAFELTTDGVQQPRAADGPVGADGGVADPEHRGDQRRDRRRLGAGSPYRPVLRHTIHRRSGQAEPDEVRPALSTVGETAEGAARRATKRRAVAARAGSWHRSGATAPPREPLIPLPGSPPPSIAPPPSGGR